MKMKWNVEDLIKSIPKNGLTDISFEQDDNFISCKLQGFRIQLLKVGENIYLTIFNDSDEDEDILDEKSIDIKSFNSLRNLIKSEYNKWKTIGKSVGNLSNFISIIKEEDGEEDYNQDKKFKNFQVNEYFPYNFDVGRRNSSGGFTQEEKSDLERLGAGEITNNSAIFKERNGLIVTITKSGPGTKKPYRASSNMNTKNSLGYATNVFLHDEWKPFLAKLDNFFKNNGSVPQLGDMKRINTDDDDYDNYE